MKNCTLLYCILATILFAGVLSVLPLMKGITRTAHTVEFVPMNESSLFPITSGEKANVKKVATERSESLPVFTKESLVKYDGTDSSLPIYIALEGNVYDVSDGAKFYGPGGAYDFLAGTDGTTLLKVFGGDLIKKKYQVVGTYSE